MKKWKKIVIVLSTVVLLFVSVFAVSASALDTSSLVYALPSVNYVYQNSSGTANYASAPILIPNLSGGNGSFGYFGDYSTIRYGWRRFESDTFYEYYQNAVTSTLRYGVSIDMSYMRCIGRNNGGVDIGLSAFCTSGIGDETDSMAPTGVSYNSWSTVRVYYIANGEEGYFSFTLGTGVVYLSSILRQYTTDVNEVYISRIDIDPIYYSSRYTTLFINFYTGAIDLSTYGSSHFPYNDYDVFMNYYNNGYTEGNDVGYTNGYNEGEDVGYNNGYNAGLELGYTPGYNDGYNEAIQQNEIIKRGMFGWIMDSVQGFMDFEIFDNFTIGWMLSVVVGVSCLIWLLKLLAGG